MPEVPCAGPCNSRYRRLTAEYEAACAKYEQALTVYTPGTGQEPPEPPESPDIQPWLGNPWCPKCQATIHQELGELDDLAAIIAARPPLASSTADESAGRVSGTRDHPSPSSRMDDLEELNGWLRNWESAYRGDDPRPRRGYLAKESTTIIAWLVSHFEPCITHPDLATDFGSETRRWHRELLGRARAGTIDKHQKRPCPRCKLYTLWARDGEDYVRCINTDCNRRMTREEFKELPSVVLVALGSLSV